MVKVRKEAYGQKEKAYEGQEKEVYGRSHCQAKKVATSVTCSYHEKEKAR